MCPCCKEWFSLERLATDPVLRLIGMSFDGNGFEVAFYFFQHENSQCGSSFLVAVDAFKSLIDEPIPEHKATLSEGCEGRCTSIEDLQTCKNECYFAPFRRLLLKMMEAKKQPIRPRSEVHLPTCSDSKPAAVVEVDE